MELMEFVMILLVCVIVSSMLDQIMSRMSLPLLQIGIGFVLAILIPRLAETEVESELFMMLFIAPLLFREAKETNIRTLWKNKWSILSMAIFLVIVTVLAAGFILNLIIPSIPLAAAFACAAALGPTDAAAVSALGSTVNLTKRQESLLSGEALINDASGVVSFQFAIAAALTGTFSLAKATWSFLILFFGGIALGIALGFVIKKIMDFLRKRGLVSTTVHVIYEVISPFVLYLAAEQIGVSGILAVVAAGLVMQETPGHIISPDIAKQQIVSNSFWEVIVFIINGVIFVMLGMQLPRVMQAEDLDGLSPALVIFAMLAVTATVILIRFIWLFVMEILECRKTKSAGGCVRQAMVTTIAGPKGAVTLSIILTIPLYLNNGEVFPHRSLIVFITSGVILCTLLLSNFVLPKLAPKENENTDDIEKNLQKAKILVLEGVTHDMRNMLKENPDSEFAPATRLVLMRYRNRLMRLRFEMDDSGDVISQLVNEVLCVQQKRVEILENESKCYENGETLPYSEILRNIRISIGYFDGAEEIELDPRKRKKKPKKIKIRRRIHRFRRKKYSEEQVSRMYYDTCHFAIDLENIAIDYLQVIEIENDEKRAEAAKILINEHEAARQSLLDRIDFEEEDMSAVEIRDNIKEQFRKAKIHADEADANGLNMELDQIRRLRADGTIGERESRVLREEVYLMQTSFL